MDIYPNWDVATLEDLFEVSKEALSCFALAMDDAVDTSIWASLQELVCLITCDKQNRVSRGGRPRLHIRKEQLDFLVEQGFMSDTSVILGCSRNNIRRRMKEYKISKTCLVIVTSLMQNLITWHPNLFPTVVRTLSVIEWDPMVLESNDKGSRS